MLNLLNLIVVLGFCSVVFCGDVLDFSGPDFEDRVTEHDAILIEFFAPWCGHCKRLAPEYEKAASELKKADPAIPLAKVDCTSDNGKDTCQKYGVNGYPTLKIFKNGEFASEYNGPRDSDGIVKYMKAQVGPSSRELQSLEDVEKFLKEEVVVIGYFSDSSSSLKDEFLKAADKLRESVLFGHTFNKEALDKKGLSDEIVLYRPKKFWNKFESNEVKYTGSADKEEIKSFVKDNYHGLVGHRTHDNHDDFKAPLIVAYYDVDYVKNVKGTNYWRNRVMKVAQSYKGEITFAVSNKDKFSAEVEDFGLKAAGDKPVIGARNAANQKFNMKEEFSVESFEAFVKKFLDGSLEPHLKSEPLPEKNDGPVKVAVAQNFQELVIDNDKDILIEFYAPWCGHCKKLAPTYEELGTTMENENVEIVKMDATANDVPPSFEVHGFPTLYWVPKDYKSSPKKYEGGRDLKDFISYIAKHATEELKGFDRSGKPKAKEEL
ncbi:protein disulfide-isomerase A3-like [Uloborus diversus]|uniref:protein disulfide-isomerase A3-like n=1 Tax=Uloborus diversus TaxID=327109 RepID=UPI0024096DF7|nr:protein disulfide-isomerase A3-like [Uloborus diversus]